MGAAHRIVDEALHQKPVELDRVERQVAHGAQRRILRPQIIQGKAEPLVAQDIHRRAQLHALERAQRFGDFDLEQVLGNIVAARDGEHRSDEAGVRTVLREKLTATGKGSNPRSIHDDSVESAFSNTK